METEKKVNERLFAELTHLKVRECEMELEQTRMRLQSTEDEKMHTEKQLERLREEQRALRLAQDELQEVH